MSLGFSRQEHWSGLPLPSPKDTASKGKWKSGQMVQLKCRQKKSGKEVRSSHQGRVQYRECQSRSLEMHTGGRSWKDELSSSWRRTVLPLMGYPSSRPPVSGEGTSQCTAYIQSQFKFLHEIAWCDKTENRKTLSFNHSWIIEKIF